MPLTPTTTPSALLEVEHLDKRFGGLQAVCDVSFTLHQGTITGLIGPNGAGKTTLFNLLAGHAAPTQGRILLRGQDITGLPPQRIFKHGLVRTFQLTRPFAELSVLDNVLIAARDQPGERLWNNWLRRATVARHEAILRERAMALLELFNLTTLAQQAAKQLSGGQRKLLDIARALMAEPQLILLDEPGAGVNRSLLNTMIQRLSELNQTGTTFLIIEHNMDLVMSLCDPVLVMANGRLLLEGTPAQVQADPRVIDAYLGGTT